MTFRIDAGFDVGAFGSLKLTDSTSAGEFEITSGLFCHINLESLYETGVYSDLASQITAEMFAESITATVTYNATTGRYVISAGGGPVNITAGVDEGDAAHARMGQVLGFSTSPGAIAGGASVTGDLPPLFSISSAMGGVSDDTDVYEGGQSDDAETESGRAYGVSATSAPRYRDFTVTHEPRAAVYIVAAETSAPWTWEHFFQHSRVVHPFAVTDDFNEGVPVLKLRAGHDRWKPKHVTRDYRGNFDLAFKVREVGRL